MDSQHESQENIAQEQDPPSVSEIFIAPSIDTTQILSGQSYTYHSALPSIITADPNTECILGIDEAGRGPVLGPMVYGVFYLPLPLHQSLLATTHHFDDSKVLTAQTRTSLMRKLCTRSTDLYEQCGWATKVLSARDISAGMLRPHKGMYNLNAQAMDATIELIRGVLDRGVNVREIYVDTVGPPQSYQKRLSSVFPTIDVTVAKKADSLYPCVSAASVCAKVTRDAALEVCFGAVVSGEEEEVEVEVEVEGWGSGYPSDARCVGWLKRNMDPLFGWGNECRFSWSTAKDLLEEKSSLGGIKVDWPVDDDNDERSGFDMTTYFSVGGGGGVGGHDEKNENDEMIGWFGGNVTQDVF